MKKILLLTVLIVLFTSCSDNILSDDSAVHMKKTPSIEQKDLSAIGINLMESFTASPLRSSVPVYPDYYCGSYIDSEGNFVILVNEDESLHRDNFIQRTKSSDFL